MSNEITTVQPQSMTIRGTTLALPSGLGLSDRVNKAGKMMGCRLSFIGPKSASELRLEGKRAGLKRNDLKLFVNRSLTGDSAAAAWVRHDAVMSGLRSAGLTPVQLDGNKKGDVYKAEYRLAPVDDSAAKLATANEELATAKAEIEAFKAKLAELTATK